MTVKRTVDTITPSLIQIQKRLDKLPREAYQYWVSITPSRSGNARRKTRLSGSTITAAYPYATQLDSGSSDLARDGMSGPTGEFIQSWAKRNIRK